MKIDYENDILQLREKIENNSRGNGTDVSESVKKIMSGFYKKVKKEFNNENSYKGDLINTIILENIKVRKSY